MVLLFFVVLGFSIPVAGHADSIKMGGTGAALGTMKRLAKAFQAKHPGVSITVLPSLGSSGGIRALRAGAIDLAVSARPLKQKERSPGIAAAAYGKTAIVFATAAKMSKTDLTVAELIEIFDGTRTQWPNGLAIRIVLRPESETDIKLMRKHLPGINGALDAARQRRNIPVFNTDQETADAIQHIPGALGPVALNLNLSERRQFHIFSLNGIPATPETIGDGTYPMTKMFYFVTGPKSGDTVRKFIAFAQSEEGTAILRRMGHYVLTGGNSQ